MHRPEDGRRNINKMQRSTRRKSSELDADKENNHKQAPCTSKLEHVPTHCSQLSVNPSPADCQLISSGELPSTLRRASACCQHGYWGATTFSGPMSLLSAGYSTRSVHRPKLAPLQVRDPGSYWPSCPSVLLQS